MILNGKYFSRLTKNDNHVEKISGNFIENGECHLVI